MLPTQPDADAPDSERRVFAGLQGQLPELWTVFHSQHLYVGASRARHVLAVIQERVSMATPSTC